MRIKDTIDAVDGFQASFGLFHILLPLITPNIIQSTSFISKEAHIAIILAMGAGTLFTALYESKANPYINAILSFAYAGSAVAEFTNTVGLDVPEITRNTLGVLDLATVASLLRKRG